MTIRDIRGQNITRDENRVVVPGVGTAVENALGQTTISLDIADLTAEALVDENADYVAVYSNTDAEHRKVLATTIPDATLTVAGTVVDVYTTPGDYVWAKPAGATMVYVYCIGSGGGGGGGGWNAVSTNVYGGAGGAGGAVTYGMLPADFLPSTVAVRVGAAGVGGTPGSAVGGGGTETNTGTDGTNGAWSYFGDFVKALGGNGGFGGTIVTLVEGKTPPAGAIGMFSGGAGGDSDDDANSVAGGTTTRHGAGGGGGGGAWQGSTNRTAANGGLASVHCPIGTVAPAFGAHATAGSATNGESAVQYCLNSSPTAGNGGAGGGAARGAASAVAGNGGNAAKYGGGGGGGGGCHTAASGRGGFGGNGADGAVMVISFL